MKLDKLPAVLAAIPKNQQFFLGCWYNLTSEDSTDSDRIPVVNPTPGLKELVDLYSLGESHNAADKRLTIGEELCSLLEKDSLLIKPHYRNLKGQLTALLDKGVPTNKGERHPINEKQTLVASLAKELIQLMSKHYINDAIEELEVLLSADFALQGDNQRIYFDKILQATRRLTSGLIAEGAHLAELASLYRNVLSKVDGSNFFERFTQLKKILLQDVGRYKVTIYLHGEEFHERVKQAGGNISIGIFEIKSGISGGCEAITEVEAKSFFKAGNAAHEALNDILDLLNHPMGRSAIVMSKQFSVEVVSAKRKKVVKLDNERLVPNPSYIFPEEKFKKFVKSISSHTESQSKNKEALLDAFRLSRIGTFSQNLETKFLTYWTALEALTHNSFPSEKREDLRIAKAVTPCIMLDYINKRVTIFLATLLHQGIVNITDVNQNFFDLSKISYVDFFKLIQTESFCDAVIEVLEHHAYFQYQFRRLAWLCNYPNKLKENLEAHKEKVEWQIQRIYRARNVIVHSGRKVEHLELLCANLEHYLKTCLSSISDLLGHSPSIVTPDECFVRYDHAVTDILCNLKVQNSKFDSLYYYLGIHQ
jgi:hypothetical protein